VQGDFRDRIGHVIACADRLNEAAATAERARDMVRVQVAAPVLASAGAGEGRA